ncbi:MAG TPA: CinA family protein [Halothiobacillaceae bacterium]|nr:CinA family protein [Halothiobacillaceae bacterium]
MSENHLPDDIAAKVNLLAESLTSSGKRLVVAESCTGGLLSTCLTDLAGSSDWFEGGWITYSNQAKMRDLGVPASVLEQHGAVSRACVETMAENAVMRAGADYAVAISGIAGPGGGSKRKPVGTVWIAWAYRDEQTIVFSARFALPGDRAAVRRAAVAIAISGLLAHLGTRSWADVNPAEWHPDFWPESGLKS